MRRLLGVLSVAALTLAAQPPKPAVLTAVCADAEIAEFNLECSAEEPCAVLLELTSIDEAGPRIVLTGNFHTGTSTLWSVVLSSVDEGVTWTEPFARIRGASLDQLHFLDPVNGWAAGQVMGTIPKDPFVLKSGDGAVSWRRVPLFDESVFATIEQIAFDSPSHGLLVLQKKGDAASRYLLMESQTGGDSWNTREAGPRPPAVTKPKAQNANLRLRADKASAAYVVERRANGRWTALAAISFKAGNCQPAPPAPPAQ